MAIKFGLDDMIHKPDIYDDVRTEVTYIHCSHRKDSFLDAVILHYFSQDKYLSDVKEKGHSHSMFPGHVRQLVTRQWLLIMHPQE